MAEDATLTELERDVEQSRARLAADIARLRAPETFEHARRSVMDSVRSYRDDAMVRAQGGARSMLDEVKARAAANPAAAAAILAGVAWRLYRHPPISSALIGAGVAMLARTDPASDRYRPQRIAQDLSQRLSARARDLSERAAAQAAELKESAGEQARRLAGAVREAPTTLEIHRVGDALVVERRVGLTREAARRRDAYLLGFAALALGAAVGVARRRPGAGERLTQNGRIS
jgi:hypothetical protein